MKAVADCSHILQGKIYVFEKVSGGIEQSNRTASHYTSH